MAAITQGFKPMFKGFVTDSVKEINKKRKVIDIIIHPTFIPFGDKTATIVNYCDEWEQSLYSPIQVLQH